MIQFFKHLFSSSTQVSSKRVAGFVGLVCALVMMFCKIEHTSVDTLLIGSFALLGASVLRREPDPFQNTNQPPAV